MERKEKWWAFLSVVNSFKENWTKINGTEERILLGDRVRKEILQNFIFLFHLVDIVFKRAFSSFSFVAAWIQCGCFSSRAPLSTVCLLCWIFFWTSFRHSCFSQKLICWMDKGCRCFIELFLLLRVLVFLFRSPCMLRNQVVRASECRNCLMCECFV